MASKPYLKGARSAFTLVEMLVSVGLAGLVIIGVGSCLLFSMRSFASLSNFSDLNNKSRNATDIISRDIRSAIYVQGATTNRLVLAGPDGVDVIYQYDASRRTLFRLRGTVTQALLSGVDSFSFALYQRPATNALYNQFSAATPATAKLVAFEWSCSRQMGGLTRVNSESVQAAVVDLRNQQ